MNEPSYLALLELASRVRACPESGACCRAAAAAALGEPVQACPACGHPLLPGDVCPCLQYIGPPPNPAAMHHHAASNDLRVAPAAEGR